MAGDAPDLSGLLGSLLSNPAALSGIAELLGGLRPSPGSEAAVGEKKAEEREASAPAEEAVAAAALPALLPQGRHGERRVLLSALGPYLSPRRRRTLDGAIRLLEIVELFRDNREGDLNV